jgi:peptidoglycan-associated lipoprotein
MMKNTGAMTTILAATAVLVSGCAAHRPMRSAQLDPAAQSAAATTPAAASAAVEAGEPVVRDDAMHPVPELKNIGFDFNSDILSADARAVLDGNARWLKDHATLRVQVTGNCDQRGTEAYNLALGQRRAKAVRDYYEMMGVEGNRVATISYGKEKPVCQEQTESCWQRNRRAETLGAYEQLVGRAGN